jgi:putative membrane protein
MLTALLGAVVLGQALPGMTPMPRSAPAPRVADDAEILGAINARDANLIEASTLASTKARNGEVKTFLADVLEDHQRSLTRGAEIAKELNLSRELPPDSAMARMQEQEMDALALLADAAFDRSYMEYVLKAHDAEVEKVAAYERTAQHPTVKAYVTARLPSLRAHQTTARAWLAANGGT